jgi:hypothetical protein
MTSGLAPVKEPDTFHAFLSTMPDAWPVVWSKSKERGDSKSQA